MATASEIGLTYNWMDRLFRAAFGETADLTCAFYDGDFSKSLEQAQSDKHAWILGTLGFKRGDRVLDIGSGWGNMLKAVADRGGSALGITLSSAQVEACRQNGLDARLKDWKEVEPDEIGTFDHIVSLGAFEHFCSIDEFKSDRQDKIYDDFFRLCHALLPPGGGLYLQTMTWGSKVPDPDRDMSLAAPEGSDEKIFGRLEVFYPGSFLPSGEEQIIECARPYFSLVSANNGRKDYIETLTQWTRTTRRYVRNPLHWPLALPILTFHLFRDEGFLQRLLFIYHCDQQEVFVRGLFDHQRMFFRRR